MEVKFQEILEKTKAEIDSLCAQAKEKLDAIAPKELEVGKWYKTERTLFNHQDGYDSYGFFNKQWTSGDWRTYLDDFAFVTPIEATPQEVEQALIEEAKRRGVKDGVRLISADGVDMIVIGVFVYKNRLPNHLFFGGAVIFRDGQWATIIEQDKFAELKEAYRNGKVIQMQDMFGGWHDVSDDSLWLTDKVYRIKPEERLQYFNLTQLTEIVKEQTKAITGMNERLKKVETSLQVAEKPEEKPKVGDVCKYWCENDPTFTVGILQEIDDEGYFWCNDYCYTHAKTLTQQETIELLFNNK